MDKPKYLTDPAQGISEPEISPDYASAVGPDTDDLAEDLAAVMEEAWEYLLKRPATIRVTCYRAETYTVDVGKWVQANHPEWLEDEE